jgi:uncharacterized membrane-anchored protein
VAGVTTDLSARLSAITAAMPTGNPQRLLAQLSDVAMEAEETNNAFHFRCTQCCAHHRIVRAELASLKMESLASTESLQDTMRNQVDASAMTCAATQQGLDQVLPVQLAPGHMHFLRLSAYTVCTLFA